MPDRQETRSIAERLADALDARSVRSAAALVSGDVAYDTPRGGRVIGREAFETALMHRFRCYEERLADREVMVSEDGHRATVEGTLRGVYRETDPGLPEARGQAYSVPAALVIEVDDGRISRLTSYLAFEALLSDLGR